MIKLRSAGIFLVLLLLFGMARTTWAATPVPTKAASVSSSPAAQAKEEGNETEVMAVEYTLPYPGILSNHPLFPLKMVRDWIFERLITDPMRKTEFYILQADKRLAMAIAFMSSVQQEEAVVAVDDAREFMQKAVTTAQSARSAGQEIPGHIMDRFERSTAKHMEVVEGFASQAEEMQSAAFRESITAFETLQNAAAALK